MSNRKWQKEIPTKDGRYWVATQDGLSAGLATVVYHPNGKRIMAGLTPHGEWGGWWFSEPVIEPPAPPADIWDRALAFAWAQAGYGAYIAPADDVGTWIVSEHRTPAEPAPETLPCTLTGSLPQEREEFVEGLVEEAAGAPARQTLRLVPAHRAEHRVAKDRGRARGLPEVRRPCPRPARRRVQYSGDRGGRDLLLVVECVHLPA